MKSLKISFLFLSFCFLISQARRIEGNSPQRVQYTINDFNVDFPEENCTHAIDSLIKLFQEGYVYTDIKKNPPNVDYFGAADIIEELKNIETSNRKYYDFFRDVKRVIGKLKDGHLSINANKSPNGFYLPMMAMCLPFRFYIVGESREEAKICMTKFPSCFDFFDLKIQELVTAYEGQCFKSINNTDPFDFIQNINQEFGAFYNKHSTFTYNLVTAHSITIARNPLSIEQLSNITFIMEGDAEFTLDYYLYYYEPNLENSEEFFKFYEEEKKREIKTLEKASILDIEDKFYKMKNNENINVEENLNWTYSTYDKNIKCRVDSINNLNVFVQNSFYFLGDNYKNAIEVVENCTELFYSNDFPIVGIESFNGGGVGKLSFYFQELLQVKILPTPHYTTLKSELMKEYVESNISDIIIDPDMYERINIETCEPFKHFDDMEEIEDDYGGGVKHKKTQYFGTFNSSDLKEHKKRRQKYFSFDKLKRPTDIIIFTDTFSFSATSFFIKGLQETGSAIIVGYFGNPKCEEVMDASQSPSFVGTFANSKIYKDLLDVGFLIGGVTIYETYNYTYQNKNPIPREYLINPVDETVDIFEAYDDNLYDKFMQKAKDIFKKYNEDKECNPNNLDLLYDPNNKQECYTFENDVHAHGGYECDTNTSKWSDQCKPYYCDIGYYFDKVQNKCILDICTEKEDEDESDTTDGKDTTDGQDTTDGKDTTDGGDQKGNGKNIKISTFNCILCLLIILW